MKKSFVSFICCFSILTATMPAAFATNLDAQIVESQDVQTIDCGDGFTITITTDIADTARSSTKSASKTAVVRYNSAEVGEFTVHGKFSYNGSSAKATNSTYDAEAYDSWDYKNASTSHSGAKVSGKCTFYKGSTSKTVSLSMTCSPSGQIS